MYIRALSTLLLPADQVEETIPKMDQNIVLEALSALTGCTVKPRPAGGTQDSLELRGGSSESNSQKIRDHQPAALKEFTPPNELTIENFISTIFIPETLQPLGPIGGSQNSLHSGPDDFTALKKDKFVNMEEFFSPEYDKDFRGSKDPSACRRGDEPYTRPWGWYRFALKVKDKYPLGNTWLGSPGWRNDSSPGEWPVSFHGTSLQGAEAIPKEQYKPGPGAAHGYGIYSTPNIKTAEVYTKNFTSKTNKKTYKVVMQNRINPEKRERTKVEDYWLIKIDRNALPGQVKKIVTESIRPYGILIKEV